MSYSVHVKDISSADAKRRQLGESPTQPVVVALGGNAIGNKRSPGTIAELNPVTRAIGDEARRGLVVTHGNGPQIGYLNEIQPPGSSQTLDILGAETEGWLGYAIEQAIAKHLPQSREVVSVVTRMQVDPDDPALQNPDKPIGRWFNKRHAQLLKAKYGWRFVQHGDHFRRVVPSPTPVQCLHINSIKALLAAGSVVICAGGGGIPVARNSTGHFTGVEAVIDKDLASALIAEQLGAGLLVLATNVKGVYSQWPPSENDSVKHHTVDQPAQSDREHNANPGPIAQATPEQLLHLDLEAGSMAPKVSAACRFTARTGKPAVIGHLDDLDLLLAQNAGTRIVNRLNATGLGHSTTGASHE